VHSAECKVQSYGVPSGRFAFCGKAALSRPLAGAPSPKGRANLSRPLRGHPLQRGGQTSPAPCGGTLPKGEGKPLPPPCGGTLPKGEGLGDPCGYSAQSWIHTAPVILSEAAQGAAKSKNLRTYRVLSSNFVRRSFGALTLAQDDKPVR